MKRYTEKELDELFPIEVGLEALRKLKEARRSLKCDNCKQQVKHPYDHQAFNQTTQKYCWFCSKSPNGLLEWLSKEF